MSNEVKTRMEWRGDHWLVELRQGDSVITLRLEEWLRLKPVQYSKELALDPGVLP
jgi:hypothetical protein